MPTSVARVGGSLPGGNFLPEVWSRKLQAKFYLSTVLDRICNHDWEGEIKDKGSKVKIRVRPTVVTRPYSVNSGISYQDLEDDYIELLLDKARYFAFKIDDIDVYQSDVSLMNECTQDAGENMKIDIDSEVLGSVYANAGLALTSTAVTKSTVLDWLVDAGTKLDESNVPETGRWAVVPPWITGSIKKSDLKDASIAGDGTSILRNGRIGMIDRFEVFNSNNVANNGTTWNCLAGTRHGICFASQVTKVQHMDKLENTFASAVRGLNVYGFKVTKPEALVHMPATKS
jgi:hypothetical protein